MAALPQHLRRNLANRDWRLANLYWVVDEHGRKVRFRPLPVQAELFANRHPLSLVLKSRQHGVSTAIQIDLLDRCLFRKHTSTGVIAHNLDDAEVMFRDKIKFGYDNLPPTVKEMVGAEQSSAKELTFTNKSKARVGTSMRSGTLQYLHISEFGKICVRYPDKAAEIVTGAFNTVHIGQTIVVESTAEGSYGPFYDMCMTALDRQRGGYELGPMDFKLHFFPWWRDAKCNISSAGVVLSGDLIDYFDELEAKHGIELGSGQKAWYAKKRETQHELMLREYPSIPEEAFRGSLKGAYYADELARARLEGRLAEVPVAEDTAIDSWWDIGFNDKTSIWFTQTDGAAVKVVGYYENQHKGLAHYIKILNEEKKRLFGTAHVLYRRHVGPHDLLQHDWSTGQTRKRTAERMGFQFEAAPKLPLTDGIQAVRNLFPRCHFDNARFQVPVKVGDAQFERIGVIHGLKGLESYRHEWDDKRGDFKDGPMHDAASHPADAFRTLATSHDRFRVTQLRPRNGQAKRERRSAAGWT